MLGKEQALWFRPRGFFILSIHIGWLLQELHLPYG